MTDIAVTKAQAFWEGDIQMLNQTPEGGSVANHDDVLGRIFLRYRHNSPMDPLADLKNIFAPVRYQQILKRTSTWTKLGQEFFGLGLKNPKIHLLEPLDLLNLIMFSN